MIEFDPVQKVQEIVVLALVSLGFILAWIYRDRILLMMTGDDVLHINLLELLYWAMCRCCGLCNGEWTRCVTRTCCCCSKRLKGQNLIKKLGQVFGLAPVAIEMRNLIVGDLPYSGAADWYIAVDCEKHPTMVTSIAEEKLPKIIHFPETLTLRLRDSILADHVTIEVRILNVMGFTVISRCQLEPCDVINWAQGSVAQRVKRIELKPVQDSVFGNGFDPETPGWIAITFGEPTEIRDLAHFGGEGDLTTVRTATVALGVDKDGDPQPADSYKMEDTPRANIAADDKTDGVLAEEYVTISGVYRDVTISRFKEEMPLLNREGKEIDEPDESTLGAVAMLRTCLACFYSICNMVMILILVVSMTARFYVWSCYRQFRNLTMMYLFDNASFPVPIQKIQKQEKECAAKFGGTGIKAGDDPCNPSTPQVLAFCGNFTEDKGAFGYPQMCDQSKGCAPRTQIRPTAGKRWMYDAFKVKMNGAYCVPGICEIRDRIIVFDRILFAFWIFAICFVLFAKLVFAKILKAFKNRKQDQYARRLREEKRILAEHDKPGQSRTGSRILAAHRGQSRTIA